MLAINTDSPDTSICVSIKKNLVKGFGTRLLTALIGKNISVPGCLKPRYKVKIGSNIIAYSKSNTREKPVLLIKIPRNNAKEKKVSISSTCASKKSIRLKMIPKSVTGEKRYPRIKPINKIKAAETSA